MGQCQWHNFPCCLGPPVPKTGPKAPWQPKSWPVRVYCSGVDTVELHRQMFALVNQEGRRGADTQSRSLPQTGDKLPHLLLQGASSQCTPTCLHPLCSTACAQSMWTTGNAFAPCTYLLSPPALLSCSFQHCCAAC